MAVDQDLLIVMNTIDETRDHMSEGKYLKTCDSLKYGYQSPNRYYFYSRELFLF